MSKNPTHIELFRSYDPVIRQHVPPRESGLYAARRDPQILRDAGLPEDAKPVLFVCTALSRSQREALETIGAQKTRWRVAFCMSLVEIRDLKGEDGRPAQPSRWTPTRSGPGAPIDEAALDALEELGFGDNDVYEIGSAVEELSSVGKGATPSCPLLDSSRRAWLTPSSSRRVEPTKGSETPTGG